MPQKLGIKIPSNPRKTLQYHQIGNREIQQFKSSPTNQGVLILSAPIKSKDAITKMEQRAIPLRIDNSQLMITATENKNNIVSLKRSIKPAPLALPINQLSNKSPTFVKNEVGKVMGKLIPLGKFSNITKKTLSPIGTASASSSLTPTTGTNNLKCNTSKQRANKILKLDEEKFGEGPKSKGKITPTSSASEIKAHNITAIVSSPIVSNVEKIKNQVITVTDNPKKRVHLVLRGYENIASVGQTGTQIKLIPLDHWKSDVKPKLTAIHSGGALIPQPEIVNVRSCTSDKIHESDVASFGGNKSDTNYGKEDFDADNILEKDPLDIGEMLETTETKTFENSLQKDSLNDDKNLKNDSAAKKTHAINKPNSIRTISESGRINSSKILTLAKGGMSVELKYDNKVKPRSIWAKKTDVLLKNSVIESEPGQTIVENAKKLEPPISDSIEKVKEEVEVEKNEVNYNELCQRFGINKNNVTPTETAMLSHIIYLKKKLHYSQKSRVQALTALQPREYLGSNNLSSIQKRFVESQLRNSGRMEKKQRFMKPDLLMAKDILRATGPRGYSNLKKLFSLPEMSAVIKEISKT